MHTTVKALIDNLVETGKPFEPVRIEGTDAYLMMTSKDSFLLDDEAVHDVTIGAGGGAYIYLQRDYRGMREGDKLLTVSEGVRSKAGLKVAKFVLGHEYGHHFLGIKSSTTSTVDAQVAVEHACDRVGIELFGREAAVTFLNAVIDACTSYEQGALLSVPSEHQEEAKKQVAFALETMLVRKALALQV